ncbi:glycerol kinase GlpK [Roseospira marina]|uniref:Glycerol kinase n=1 Tax=Roseospira marina TaxID=140057 RepID=A0A5M6IAN5_9PROT|nr:glycerol kinase GlpK [Roseospira marina]KAA5605212.1 glycerol kinase GlpK [Roseospira marina]MBB4314667.1 glycerol kinase [Roseospira marina]MBB5087656.1 glycerol kinase [Roseospira marina]
MSGYVLAIDQGTTSTRSIVFSDRYAVAGTGQREFTQHFPRSGWVEHEPDDLWTTTVDTMRLALADAGLSATDIAAIGITNQRETTLIWDRETGKPIHRALVWQDRRTADLCSRLSADGLEPLVTERTGLIIDPYFSGSKIAWLLDTVEGARERAEAGTLAFGTVDTWLIWNLTGGKRHVTDATNASRSMLYDINRNTWDDDLLRALNIPRALLPEVLDCADDFGTTDPSILGTGIPIRGVAGDQQAAMVGQACFSPGMIKSTYGTGCFALINTGTDRVASKNRLLTTIGYRLNGVTTYALEGAIFIAGAAVQWLRDELGVIERADQSGPLAAQADPEQAVYLVPAFTGLGAPHWDPHARGALFGLTRATGRCELARAALESVCYQTADLSQAMHDDWSHENERTVLRVDGGMVASDWTMQRLADLLGAPVDRPMVLETTAMGAAWLAGHKVGAWPDAEGFATGWRLERRFEPNLDEASRERGLAGWRDAVQRTLTR